MRRETRQKYNLLLAAMAASYEVANTNQSFTATVPMAQALNDAVQESIEFLQRISTIYVTDVKGEILEMTVPSTVAGRTAITGGAKRVPQQAGAPDGRQYECTQTNYDIAFGYALLDAWARYPDFQARYMKAVYQRIGLDRMLIGFYGSSAAATTNRVANPKLSDVNTGWLHDLKTNAPDQYFKGDGEEGAEKITIGGVGSVYANLHQMVYDVGQLIPVHRRTGNEVAVIGQGLVAHDMNKTLAAYGDKPSEAVHFGILAKSYGGYQSIVVPQFPENGLLITDLRNLQLYLQDSGVRRHTKEEPEANQVADYISDNESYRIGDLKAAAMIEAANVVLA